MPRVSDLQRTQNQKNKVERQPKSEFNVMQFGTSGTRIFGGMFDEEYLGKLNANDRAEIFDQMKRSDGQINMLLTARKNPILSANWRIEPGIAPPGFSQELQDKIADHINYEMFERMDKPFNELLGEILSFIEFGWSMFERVHMPIFNDPQFGTYVGFKNIAWRSQRTIDEFHVDRDGSLIEIFQQSDGDLANFESIPGKYSTVFSLRKIGDNYEGISALRPIYGAWLRKCMFQKLLAIGVERYAVGTPIGTIPAGKEEGAEKQRFVEMLKRFISHENGYFVKPQGWELDFSKGNFDADKVKQAIEMENLEMAKSFVAPHLELGTGGNGGAYALGNDFSDQFLSIIQNDAEIAARGINKTVIKEFVEFNYGKQPVYPKMKVTGINDKVGKEYAEIIKVLVDAKAITPNKNLEVFLRNEFKMPELSEEELVEVPDIRETDEPSLFGEVKLSEVQLQELRKEASKTHAALKKKAEEMETLMRTELSKRAKEMIDRITNRLKRTPLSQWRKVARTEELRGQREYRQKIERELVQAAGKGVSIARQQTPDGQKVKLFEGLKTRITLADSDETLKGLPKNTQEAIKTETTLLVGTQDSDLEKNILFRLNTQVDSTNDPELIRKDLQKSADNFISGSAVTAAASNTVAKVFNTARNDFFLGDEVFEKVEAFKFDNPSPVSPICQDLQGRIFLKDDPEAARFFPPLHHNCKSILIPIFVLGNRKIDERGLKPSDPKLEKFATLKSS